MIKNNATFDKIYNDGLIKFGYKIVKIGSGNYIINPHKFKEDTRAIEVS